MSTNDKKDNVIELRSDVEYHDKQLYNLTEDMRLLLNARIPEIKQSLSTINNSIHSLNNTVRSIEEVNKIRDEKMDKKIDSIKFSINNLFWCLIAFDTVLFLTSIFIK